MDINDYPRGTIIQIEHRDTPEARAAKAAAATLDPKSEAADIPDGLYRVQGPAQFNPGCQRIEPLGRGYLLTQADEHLIVAAWDSGDDDGGWWYRRLIDEDPKPPKPPKPSEPAPVPREKAAT